MVLITSKKTSVNQLPAIAKEVDRRFGWKRGTVNFDIGAGRYNRLSAYLEARGVMNCSYDPYNRTADENLYAVRKCPFDTITLSNVLNVVGFRARQSILKAARGLLKRSGVAYITVYEGDRSGKARVSKAACWQEHRKTDTYVPEIMAFFPQVERRGKLIIARKG